MAADNLTELANDIQNGATVINRIANLANLEIYDDLTIKAIGITCVIGASIAAICFVISLAYNYLKTALENLFNIDDVGKFPNYMEISRGVLFIILISIYPLLAIVLTGTIESFNKMSSPVQSKNIELAELANSYSNMVKLSYNEIEHEALVSAQEGLTGTPEDQVAADNQLQSGDETDVSKESASTEAVNDSYSFKEILSLLNPSTWIALGIQATFHFLFGIARIVISSITAIIFKVLIIVGPMAFAFSILPVFEKQISIWFGTVLNTGFVFTTLNILDHISLSMFQYIFKEGSAGILFPNYVVIFDSVLLIIYLTAFWLTSKYVGKGDAGRVLSKMVAVGTAAAAIMTGGAAAGAAGGNLNNAITTANNIGDKK